jgi:nicotinamidase/pyrazinamidase
VPGSVRRPRRHLTAEAVRRPPQIRFSTASTQFAHVVLTQDWHPPGHTSFASSHPSKQPFETIEAVYGQQVLWSDHCVQGTEGAAFHPGLAFRHAELLLGKGFRPEIDSYSAFHENDRRTPPG